MQEVLGEFMQEPMLRLNGVNENLRILVETELRGADSPAKVEQALNTLFPEFPSQDNSEQPVLGKGMNVVLSLIHI